MTLTPSTLFVWSGGGLPGLDIHVGIWRALTDLGIEATANAGTSAGAIMGALNSRGMSSMDAVKLVHGLWDADVRRERPFWKVRIPWIDSFLDPAPIKALLDRYLPEKFSDLAKPLCVGVTNERTGMPEFHRQGDLRETVLASMSIAGVFPPVRDDLSDGGPTCNIPLPAGWNGYERIVVCVAKRPMDDYRARRESMLTRLMRNADVLMETQVRSTIAHVLAERPDTLVIRPPVRAPLGSLHFDHGLIQEAYTFARMVIAAHQRKGAA